MRDLLPALPDEPFADHLPHIVRVETVNIGESSARVLRLLDESGPISYLKVEPRADIKLRPLETLAAEVARLRWLADRLPVPRVLAYHEDAAHGYLLTAAIPGKDIATLAERKDMDASALIRLLAHGLRQIHDVPIDNCPFDHGLTHEIERARERVRLGLVDEDDFEPQWLGLSAEVLFEKLLAIMPHVEDHRADLVITHGDYCLPNIMVNGDTVSGFIDLGTAGVGDRYRDLALARRSLIRNCGTGWESLFFEAYGLAEPDERKLEFYLMLDEFY